MRRVVVTGLSAITPLGVGVRRTWSRILNGECGVTSVRDRSERFAALPCHVAAVVPEGPKEDGKWTPLEWVSKDEAHKTAKFAQYGLAAAEEALQDAGWKPTEPDDLEATGVCLGSGIGNLEDLYDTSVAYNTGGYRKIHPLFVPRLLINLGAGHISLRYGFKVATNFPSFECLADHVQGPNHAVTTACTTGAHSIGDAYRFIAFGDADVMVAGGSESCIHPLAIGGFARSRSLTTDFNDTPQRASRPFDKDRSGFVIGEGAGVLVLEELEHAKARGAKIYAEVAGYGCTADAHHLTAPLADGGGAYRAMKQALKNAQIAPASVDYINAHATSTPLGDAAENRAVKRLMLGPEGKEKASEINVSSTKGAIGHLLGAAGSIEALFTVLAIHEGILPPTINLDSKTSDFDCNYVPNTAQEQKVDIALTNSFGFGGTNASLCFAKYGR